MKQNLIFSTLAITWALMFFIVAGGAPAMPTVSLSAKIMGQQEPVTTVQTGFRVVPWAHFSAVKI